MQIVLENVGCDEVCSSTEDRVMGLTMKGRCLKGIWVSVDRASIIGRA